jgi:hypothetical protein
MIDCLRIKEENSEEQEEQLQGEPLCLRQSTRKEQILQNTPPTLSPRLRCGAAGGGSGPQDGGDVC